MSNLDRIVQALKEGGEMTAEGISSRSNVNLLDVEKVLDGLVKLGKVISRTDVFIVPDDTANKLFGGLAPPLYKSITTLYRLISKK